MMHCGTRPKSETSCWCDSQVSEFRSPMVKVEKAQAVGNVRHLRLAPGRTRWCLTTARTSPELAQELCRLPGGGGPKYLAAYAETE